MWLLENLKSHTWFMFMAHIVFPLDCVLPGYQESFHHCHCSVPSSVPTNQGKQKLQTSSLLSTSQLHHLHSPPTYMFYTILSLALILLVSYQTTLSRNGLYSFTLLVKFNDSLKVSYNFHLKIKSRGIKIGRTKGEIIRNRSKELFCFPLHVLLLTFPPPHGG